MQAIVTNSSTGQIVLEEAEEGGNQSDEEKPKSEVGNDVDTVVGQADLNDRMLEEGGAEDQLEASPRKETAE